MTAATSASLLGKYWYSEPMLTPAFSAMRLVLALSKPSRTRMRAVASTSASTVARDRAWAADFLGFVAFLRAIILCRRCEYKKRVVAHILSSRGPRDNPREHEHARHLAAPVPVQGLGRRRAAD